MKKICLLVAAVFCSTILFAQLSTIKGKLLTPKATEMYLFTIEEGKMVQHAVTKIAEDGSYGFTFKAPYEGFYVVGGQYMKDFQVPVYLKPGDSAEVILENLTATFSKMNTAENLVLGDWINLSALTKGHSVYFMITNGTYKDFYPAFEKLQVDSKQFAASIKTKNSKFNELMKDVVGFDTDFFGILFTRTPRSIHPTKEEIPSFYSNVVVKNRFPNDNVLKTMYGWMYITMYLEYPKYKTKEEQLALLSTNIQKGAYLIGVSASLKSYEAYLRFMDQYKHYFVTEKQKKAIADLGSNLFEVKQGIKAADFTYPDVNGKMVSLSDFKGKVVLIDVWATWCAPCKEEIPALQELEKEFHGNDNLVFMSVSVDDDKAKWEKMVNDKKLGG